MRLRSALLTALTLLVVPLAASARVQLRETGSTLLYPVMNAWVAAYGKVAPDVDVATEATGSGAGVAAAESGSANLGASDAYLTNDAASRGDLVQIPLAISGQFVAYNLSGVTGLKLTGDVLAAIYTGKIVKWNDPKIAALNAGLKLPDETIVPLRRSDKSGDTFLFTSFLASAAPHAWTIAPATSIAWPGVAGEETAKGNPELLQLLQNTRDGIAYIGISLYEQTAAKGLGIAALRNRDGQFVMPTKAALQEATSRIGHVARDGRVSLIDLPGAHTYPIANVEYAIVKKKQPDAGTAQSLRAFLGWIIDPTGGNAPAMLDPVHFVPLPDSLRGLSRETIAALK